MKTFPKKMVSLVALVSLLFSFSISAQAVGITETECDSSRQLLSDMVAYEGVINDKTSLYDDNVKDAIEENLNNIFEDWKQENFRKPKNVTLNSIAVVPVADTLMYDELNESYQESLKYVKEKYDNDEDLFTYAVCYDYTTKTLFGGSAENKVYCFAGASEEGELLNTNVNDIECSDEAITAAAVVGYAGTWALNFEY